MAVDMTTRDDTTLSREPESRPGHIDTLVKGVDRYNPSNCHLLEDYLKDQLSNDTYDPFANLALLKLYQFNPSLLSPQAAISVLFLALVNAPFEPDFSLAWSLLSDSFVTGAPLPPASFEDDDEQDDEEMDDDDERERRSKPAQDQGERATTDFLRSVEQALRSRDMKRVWSSLSPKADAEIDPDESVEKVLGTVKASAPAWEARLRQSIAKELERSFASLPRQALSAFLGLEWNDKQMQELVSSRGWDASAAADNVRLQQKKATAVPTTTQSKAGSLAIEQISPLMSSK